MDPYVLRLFLGVFVPAALFFTAVPALAGEIAVWAIDDAVRIDPETGKAFEDNPKQLPGCVTGDYRSANWIWPGQEQTVGVCGAKNEVVAFQLILAGRAERVTVEASDLAGPAGAVIAAKQVQLFREWYIWVDPQKGNEEDRSCMAPLGPGWYPDVVIPLSEGKYGNGFSIPSKDFHDVGGSRFPQQTNQAIWVDVHIPKDAKAGSYTGTITVTADGSSKSVKLHLDVWNFAIPAAMHMHAELMNYGATIREPDVAMMYHYFRLAHEHRTLVSDNKAKPRYDGNDYDWKEFDKRFGPLFDGSIFTEGPTAGVPLAYWTVPVEYSVVRVDKENKAPFADWPIAVTKTQTGYGVQFTDAFRQDLEKALRKWESHFRAKGWGKTVCCVWQDSLDEPGFHMSGRGLEAGKEQALAIYQTAALVKSIGAGNLIYKLDIGGGNNRNKLDLDGNGKVEGAVDVANYFGPVVALFSVHGLCIDVPALEPQMQRHGVKAIFYNGYHPRVGPNTIHGELLGLRTWAVTAWRSGLAGWADWQFRLDDGKPVFYEPNNAVGRNFYFYRGEPIGLPGKLFASLRLKAMRRGAQDYEMLRLLAQKDGQDRRAQAMASAVCGAGFKEVAVDIKDFRDDVVGIDKPYTGVDPKAHWSHNAEAWEKFRRALGQALNKAE